MQVPAIEAGMNMPPGRGGAEGGMIIASSKPQAPGKSTI